MQERKQRTLCDKEQSVVFLYSLKTYHCNTFFFHHKKRRGLICFLQKNLYVRCRNNRKRANDVKSCRPHSLNDYHYIRSVLAVSSKKS